jgi:hypothetical protein
MDTAKPSQSGVAIKWALINFLTAVVVTYGIQFAGGSPFGPVSYVGDIPFIAFLCLSQIEYRKQLSGFMNYGQGFLEGFLFSLFSAILAAIFVGLYAAILNPDVWQKYVDAQQAAYAQRGMTSDQIDTAMGLLRNYGVLFVIVGSLFGVTIIGTIISLITAAIFKKERTLADIERQANDPAV